MISFAQFYFEFYFPLGHFYVRPQKISQDYFLWSWEAPIYFSVTSVYFFHSTSFLLKKILHLFKCLVTFPCQASWLLNLSIWSIQIQWCVLSFPSILDKLHLPFHLYLAAQYYLLKNPSISGRCYISWLNLCCFPALWDESILGLEKNGRNHMEESVFSFITISYILVLW